MKGAFIMSRKTKGSPEEKVNLIKKYLSGEISAKNAYIEAGIVKSSFRAWVRLYKQEGALGLLSTENNRSYSLKLKYAAVEEYILGEGSQSDICEKYKIRSTKQLRDWIKLYNSGKNSKKMSGGSRMSLSRKTTIEERINIAKECIESGNNYDEITRKYNVGYQQVYAWVKKFKEFGSSGLEDRRGQRKIDQQPRTEQEEASIKIARLEHENYLLKMERDLLKKAEELERGDVFRK